MGLGSCFGKVQCYFNCLGADVIANTDFPSISEVNVMFMDNYMRALAPEAGITGMDQ